MHWCGFKFLSFFFTYHMMLRNTVLIYNSTNLGCYYFYFSHQKSLSILYHVCWCTNLLDCHPLVKFFVGRPLLSIYSGSLNLNSKSYFPLSLSPLMLYLRFNIYNMKTRFCTMSESQTPSDWNWEAGRRGAHWHRVDFHFGAG